MLLKVELVYYKAGINFITLALNMPAFLYFSILGSEEEDFSWDSFYKKSKKGICMLAPFHAQNSAKQDLETMEVHAFCYN